MPDLDDLPDLLRADAARVVPPPVSSVLHRARRRRQRRTAVSGLGVALLVLLAVTVLPGRDGPSPERLAGPAGEVELLAGSDAEGAWRLVWRADGRCIALVRSTGEGGSCDLADPPSLDELTVRVVGAGGVAETLVAGLVPEGTLTVEVTGTDGQQAAVDVVRAGAATLYAARLGGISGVLEVVAVGDGGQALAAFDGPAVPPPPPDPVDTDLTARQVVPAVWLVESVSADRRTVELLIHPRAGGCTRQVGTQVMDGPEGLRLTVLVDVPVAPVPCPAAPGPGRESVELPRPLGPDEQVLGACLPDASTAEGQTCAGLIPYTAAPTG